MLLALSLLLLLAALGWRAIDSLFGGMCGSTEITRLPAPNGRHDAVLFEHNCGATTDFATHVSVIPTSAPLSDAPGNAFAAGPGDGPRADWGGPPVTLRWAADGALVIGYGAGAEVFTAVERVDGVAVRLNGYGTTTPGEVKP
ncbi:MAG: hypothetical protein QM692_17230 [Thermomicrobiales bacterium]